MADHVIKENLRAIKLAISSLLSSKTKKRGFDERVKSTWNQVTEFFSQCSWKYFFKTDMSITCSYPACIMTSNDTSNFILLYACKYSVY